MQGGNVVDNPRECATVGISDFNYDLTNTENWEYVFIDPCIFVTGILLPANSPAQR